MNISHRIWWLLVAATVFVGCRTEETRRPVPTQVTSRAKAVEQAEGRSAAAAQSQDQGATGAASSAAGTAAPAATYLPPSERGAEVQITETPLDGSTAAAGAAASARASGAARGGADAERGPAGGGGNMPSGVSAAMPPAANAGNRSGGGPATVGARTGVSPDAAGELGDTAASTAAARTSAEQTQAINAELQRKLAEFDALMRKAQEEAAKARASGAVGSPDNGVGSGPRGGALEAPPAAIGTGGAAAGGTGAGNAPDRAGATGLPPVRNPRTGTTPVEAAERGDDDVVARQLREAAEREADPVLREKLWQEYRNYKGGLGS